MSVGDYVEGYTTEQAEMDEQWEEFEAIVAKLEMPFFHVRGNHDINMPLTRKAWSERHGPKYYHFRYKDVLLELTICQVTGRAPRTVAQYLVIVEHFHPELLEKTHRDWLKGRRRKRRAGANLPAEAMVPMTESLKGNATLETHHGESAAPGCSEEADRKTRGVRPQESPDRGTQTVQDHSPDICPKSR